MTLWADYSGGYPGAAALRAAGFSGAIRYIGEGGSLKRLSAAERADFDSHGFPYLLVCELDVTDAEGGYSRGQQFGVDALADARYKGVLDSVGIACAADEHLTAAQIPAAVEFARGFRDVVGQARAGAYGFSEFVAAVHAAGLASWYWQSGAKPASPGTGDYVHFWQRNGSDGRPTTVYANGVQCDINDQLRPLTAADPKDPSEMADFFVKLSTATKDVNGVVTGYPDCAQQAGPLFIGSDYGNAAATVAKGQGSLTGLLDVEWNDRKAKSDNVLSVPAKLDAVSASLAALPAALAAAMPAASLSPAQVQAIATAVTGVPVNVSALSQASIADTTVTVLGNKLKAV